MGRDFVYDINEAAPPPVAEGILAGARTSGWGHELPFRERPKLPFRSVPPTAVKCEWTLRETCVSGALAFSTQAKAHAR